MQVACYRYYLSYSLETYLFRDKEMLCYKNPIFILPGLAAALLLSYYLLASLSRSLVVSVIKDSNFPTYLPPYIRNIVLRKPRLDCIKLSDLGPSSSVKLGERRPLRVISCSHGAGDPCLSAFTVI